MMKQKFGLALFVISLLLLAACTPQAAEVDGVVEVVEPAVEAVVEETADEPEAEAEPEESGEEGMAEEMEEEMEEEAADEPASSSARDVEIMTVDDRSNSLSRLTSSWNTNWELHSVSYDEFLSGGPPRDGIPSIDDPAFVSIAEADEWLVGVEPVVALEINGDARAYPLQILTWHEIVNDEVGGRPVIVTFCPLCNAAIVFDRTVDGVPSEFGVSGLLRNSDMIMYDRNGENLWQQFLGEAIVGDATGTRLEFLPSLLISYDDFKGSYPEGVVLSNATGFGRRYGQNPYVGYDRAGSNPFLFDGVIDGRLTATERVIALTVEDVGEDVAYPYSVLSEMGAVNDNRGGQDIVIFHQFGTASALDAAAIAAGKDVGAAVVFSRMVDGQSLTFEQDEGLFVDAETGTKWNITGLAVEGELVGTQLDPVVHGNHFWFSWAAFKPDTEIYTGG